MRGHLAEVVGEKIGEKITGFMIDKLLTAARLIFSKRKDIEQISVTLQVVTPLPAEVGDPSKLIKDALNRLRRAVNGKTRIDMEIGVAEICDSDVCVTLQFGYEGYTTYDVFNLEEYDESDTDDLLAFSMDFKLLIPKEHLGNKERMRRAIILAGRLLAELSRILPERDFPLRRAVFEVTFKGTIDSKTLEDLRKIVGKSGSIVSDSSGRFILSYGDDPEIMIWAISIIKDVII